MTTFEAKVLYAVEDESERSDVKVWSRLKSRPSDPSLAVGGFVDAVVVASVVVVVATVGMAVPLVLGAADGAAVALTAVVAAVVEMAAVVGAAVDVVTSVTTKIKLFKQFQGSYRVVEIASLYTVFHEEKRFHNTAHN